MELLEKFVRLTHTQMPQPSLFGYAHIFWIVICIISIVIVSLTCKNLSDKKLRRILLISAGSLLFLEMIKQLNFAYDPSTGVWEYYWKQFPFQFCSVPMYIMVLAGVIKEGKFRSALYSFLATFGLFAGLVVTVFPATILSNIVFRFSQSMIHHITMLVIGILMYVSGRVQFKNKTILQSIPIFLTCVVIAFTMNIIFHASGNTASFNMFYIGPYSSCDIPVLSSIGDMLKIDSENLHFGNFVFLFIYAIGFSLASYIVLLVAILINKRLTKNKS